MASGLFLQLIDVPPNPPIAYLVTQTLWTLTSPCIAESTYVVLNLCLVGFFWTLPAFPTEIGIENELPAEQRTGKSLYDSKTKFMFHWYSSCCD